MKKKKMTVIELIRVLASCEPNAELDLGYKDSTCGYFSKIQYEAIYSHNKREVSICFKKAEESNDEY